MSTDTTTSFASAAWRAYVERIRPAPAAVASDQQAADPPPALKSRLCPDCDVAWVSREVVCWMCERTVA